MCLWRPGHRAVPRVLVLADSSLSIMGREQDREIFFEMKSRYGLEVHAYSAGGAAFGKAGRRGAYCDEVGAAELVSAWAAYDPPDAVIVMLSGNVYKSKLGATKAGWNRLLREVVWPLIGDCHDRLFFVDPYSPAFVSKEWPPVVCTHWLARAMRRTGTVVDLGLPSLGSASYGDGQHFSEDGWQRYMPRFARHLRRILGLRERSRLGDETLSSMAKRRRSYAPADSKVPWRP